MLTRYLNMKEQEWTGLNYTDKKETVIIGFGYCDDIDENGEYTQRFSTELVRELRPDLFN